MTRTTRALLVLLAFAAIALGVCAASTHAAQQDAVARPLARLALWTVISAPASLSADGRYVALESEAGLVSIDTNGGADIYVLDRVTNRLTLESVAFDGGPANGSSRHGRLSGDGRWVVFESAARNLVRESSPRIADLFLRDRATGTTRRLIPADRDIGAHATGYEPVISADGRVVAFTSHVPQLIDGADANSSGASNGNGNGNGRGRGSDIYVVNTETGALVRASVTTSGVRPAMGSSFSPSVSADGNVVAFTSAADLVSGGAKLPQLQVYVRDVARGVTRLVSSKPNGRVANGASYTPSISGDGQIVAFVSGASDLGPSDDNHQPDIYLRDLETGAITLASRTPQGKAANGSSTNPAVSADGQFVAFVSNASDLVCAKRCSPGEIDNNLLPDVFLADLRTGGIQRVSGAADAAWWTPSAAPAVDAHARVVLFPSKEPISIRDLSGDFDLFAWIREVAAGS
jgi:Tol biopolymer transport system component